MSIIDQTARTAEAVVDVVHTVADGVAELASDGVEQVVALSGTRRPSRNWLWMVLAAFALIVVAGFVKSRRSNSAAAHEEAVRPIRAA